MASLLKYIYPWQWQFIIKLVDFITSLDFSLFSDMGLNDIKEPRE